MPNEEEREAPQPRRNPIRGPARQGRTPPVAPVVPMFQCGPVTDPETGITRTMHVPVAQNGVIISPRRHYGDGLDGQVECVACGKIVGRIMLPTHQIEWYD